MSFRLSHLLYVSMRSLVPRISLKTFFVAFEWLGPGSDWYLPSILVTKHKSGCVQTWAYMMLPTGEGCGTDFIWSILYWFLGQWNVSNLSHLTIGAGKGEHLCILNIFSTLLKYSFCDSPNINSAYLDVSRCRGHTRLHQNISYQNSMVENSWSHARYHYRYMQTMCARSCP